MKGLISYKNTTSPVKDVDIKKGVITGYLSDFDTKDYDGDVIVKGAYKKTITERNQFFLNQHNWAQPHGKFSLLQEDSKGLYFESNPLINTTYSQDTLKLYEAGIIKEHSVGFITINDEYSQKDNARIIKEIKLLEGSNVTLGANPNTPFTGFKSMTMKETNEQVKKIVKMLRNGTLTDETFALLEIALKQLQSQAYNLGVKSLDKKEPLNNTPLIVKPNEIDTKTIETINNFTQTL